ncbi:M20/M25/M40 family metallo-hydrolase [Flagellimonas sp. 2504JD1-5]
MGTINFENQKVEWLQELFEFLSIPSISTDSAYTGSIEDAADFVLSSLKKAGCTKTSKITRYGNPLVYGEYIKDKSYPTILVYGHYDVQPPGDEKLWNHGPFVPYLEATKLHPQGAIWARGASDQKGQLFIHIKAFQYLVQYNQLNCNIKFIVEGEEEIGSINLHTFVKDNKELLASDIVLISDTAFVEKDVPTITTGLRGFTGLEVSLKTTEDDLHSGLFGGAFINPVFELCRLVAGLKDEYAKIKIDGFYENVLEMDDKGRAILNQYPLKIRGKEKRFLNGENGYSSLEHVSIRPSLDVHGIQGGFMEKGIKTIIPYKASTKISLRLVANQNAKEIQEKLIAYFQENVAGNITIKILKLPCAEPYHINSNNKWLSIAKKALKEIYQKDVYELKSGGSLPIAGTFEKELGSKSILIGFGLNSDNVHGVNEHFGISNFYNGIRTMISLYESYSAVHSG